MSYIGNKRVLKVMVTEYANDTPTQEKSLDITENGAYEVTPDSDYALSKATVNVNVEGGAEPVLQEKTVTENGEVTPDSGYDGLSKVTVNVPASSEIPDGYIQPSGTKEITSNGSYDVTEYSSVSVSVPTESISGGVLLQAGTYQMTAYHYGTENLGTWSSEEIGGKLTSTYGGVTDVPFTHIRNDGEWCVEFYNADESASMENINPSWYPEAYTLTIKIDKAYLVSEAFKTWFDKSFVEVEDSGGDGGSGGDSGSGDNTGDGEITQMYMRAGTYNITKTYPDSYASIPSGAYETTANVSGSVWYAGGEMGTFDSIKLSNSGSGEPYVTVGFYSNGSLLVSWGYTDSWDGFAFNITSDALVPILFYLIASEMFTKQ